MATSWKRRKGCSWRVMISGPRYSTSKKPKSFYERCTHRRRPVPRSPETTDGFKVMRRRKTITRQSLVLDALCNPKRLEALRLLLEKEYAVATLAGTLSLSSSALSQHLAILRVSGLVTYRKSGQTVFYKCDAIIVRRLIELLDEFLSESSSGQ